MRWSGNCEKKLRALVKELCPSTKARPTCLRRPYLFPCVGKDRGEKDAVRSETAITYRLKKGTVVIDRPFCLSMNDCRKIPSLLVMAVSVRKKFAACACGRRTGRCRHRPLRLYGKIAQKPNCEPGSQFGKEEAALEDKKHRAAMLRSVKAASDAGIGSYIFPEGF